MAGCGTMVNVTIPTRYSAKVIQMRCGSTGVYGYPNLCEECSRKYAGRDWRKEAILDGENWEDDDGW